MRSVPILNDTFYHVYNRGNSKQTLFHTKTDYIRFLYLVLYLQSPETFLHVSRHISHYLKRDEFKFSSNDIQKIVENRYVQVLNFCIMPNHFHITLKNDSEDGISRYMHRISNAYAKYFNTKYKSTGHVFQGAYQARMVTTDQQLTYLSAYIHRNPRELTRWKNKEQLYPWSSFQDHTSNRWGRLLCAKYVLESFSSTKEYLQFVDESGAKEDFT